MSGGGGYTYFAGCPMSRTLRDVGLPEMSGIDGYVLEDAGQEGPDCIFRS